MALTYKQKQNLDKLPTSDLIELVDYCLSESLGVISVSDYILYSQTPKATVYKMIKDGKLKTINLIGIIGIIMNDK